MTHTNKILVIGAGIAGPAISYWLKKYGFNPTLIEKSKALRTGGYPIDIRGIALDVVKKMGIYSKICEERTTLLSMRYVDTDGQTLSEETGEKAGFREGDDVEILRGELVNILLDANPDVPCYFNRDVINLTQADQFVDVTFKDGNSDRYDLVIATDGLHSPTRAMTFSDEDYELFSLDSYISVCSIPNYLHLSRVQVLFEKDQKLITMNNDKNPDTALANFAFRSKEVLSDVDSESGQKKCLRDLFSDLGWESNKMLDLINDSTDFYFDIMAQIKMDSWTKGRVALLGDAGYCASPLSGQGTSLAIVGAYILAGELKSAKGDHSKAFKRYNELMRPLVDTTQDFGAWVGEYFLAEGEVSKEIIEQRTNIILKKIKVAANAISLPDYV